jgi:Flp pilus assembly protein TadG
MHHRHLLQRAEGQSIVLIALALLVLVAMAGLGLDGANAFNQRRNTSNAADAAAMAGTRVLVEEKKTGTKSGDAVRTAVQNYLNQHTLNQGTLGNSFPWQAYYVDYQKNDISEVTAGSTIPNSARGIRVSTQYTFNTVIMPVLGQNTLTVDGAATAIAGVPGNIVGADLIPLAIPEDWAKKMKEDGDTVSGTLWDFNGGSNYTPGNFGSVNFTRSASNGNGNDCQSGNPNPQADTQSYWWCNGSQYPVYIGQYLDGNPGNLPGLRSDIQWRINNRPYAIAPVFDTVSGSGSNAQFHIVGFLKVRLTEVDMTGNPKTIEAKYQDYITTMGGEIDDPSLDPSDFDLYAINLVR